VADDSLTSLQREVLAIFFALPESTGYLLAGGAALIATGLSTRPTDDLDLFGSDLTRGVGDAADALEGASIDRGWSIERVRDTTTFRRLVIRTGSDELVVDLAVDSPPLGPPTITTLGPAFAPVELAARKLLALFDRAAARDFVDAHTLSAQLDLDEVLQQAAELDGGFDLAVFTEMLSTLDRYTDEDIETHGAHPAAVRAFTTVWRQVLTAKLDRT
jgi:hypothetical protein